MKITEQWRRHRSWRESRTWLALVAATGMLTLLAGCGGTQATAHLTKVTMSYASTSTVFAPLFVALDKGYFTREGLSVSTEEMHGPTAVGGLLSGQLDILGGAPGDAANTDAAAGSSKLVMIVSLASTPSQMIFGSRQVRNVKSLAGKTIATVDLGGAPSMFLHFVLAKNGLNAPGAVRIVAGGTWGGVLGLLKKGAVQAAELPPPFSAEAAASGFPRLVNGFTYPSPMEYGDVVVTRAYLQSHRATVQRFLKAYLAAWAFLRNPANATAVEQIIAKTSHVSTSSASTAYHTFFSLWQRRPVPTVSVRGVANFLKYSPNPKTQRLVPQDVLDNSLVAALAHSSSATKG